MENISRHQCFVYKGAPSDHLGSLALAISKKLKENYRCLYLHSPEMVEAMRSSLQTLKVKVADETERTRLLMTSATSVSAGGRFDAELMIGRLEDAAQQAVRDGFKGLFATGDMTWELGAFKDSFTTLIDYEAKLEKLFHRQPALCGICQYHEDTLSSEMMRAGLLSHKAIFISDTLSRINDFYSDSTLEAEKKVSRDAQELDNAVNELFQSQQTVSVAY